MPPFLKALTIRQPWAWAIMAGHKRVENRTWHTRYRGPLAIHAGRSIHKIQDLLEEVETVVGFAPTIDELTFGAVIGVVLLADCLPIDEAGRKYTWLATHAFADGPYCWVLDNPRPLSEPIAATGRQGLCKWEHESITPQKVFQKLLF